jgi:hypothetical protein
MLNCFERSLTIKLVVFEAPHPVGRRQSSRLLRPTYNSAFSKVSVSEVVTFVGRRLSGKSSACK